ncbi:MAG: SWIM zinc finger family protein [Hormoscilla sp. SP5CHS1]|nr:SWIM zinc finger family protein [Hormoscilla sp. SP12CHS1]MBC6453416.1 SWIM zinc finger family protein [Hormoscilla sp. SP5CHS1]
MAKQQFSKIWWGKRFIAALERFSDSARLGRGRSYARNGKVKEFQIVDGRIKARVRGSINRHLGVYKEHLYKTKIEFKKISSADWSKAISYLGSKASLVSKLLMNEVPDNIDDAFGHLNLHLLPYRSDEFHTSCSCPDLSNPCRHIAGVYYLVASELDRDPFLLFELRGLERSTLQAELAQTPLGKVLSEAIATPESPNAARKSYYTTPEKLELPDVRHPKDFWHGAKRLPQQVETAAVASIPAIAVKKAGDFPPFWRQDNSFIEVMEELYQRVRTKNKGAGLA